MGPRLGHRGAVNPAEESERLHREQMDRARNLQAFHYGWETEAESRLDEALALAGIVILTLTLIGAGTVVWGAMRAWRLWWAL